MKIVITVLVVLSFGVGASPLKEAQQALQQGKHNQARQRLQQYPDSAEAQLLLAQLATDLDQAESHINEALSLAPDNPDVLYQCGIIMGRQASEAFLSALSYASQSLECLQKAVALSPHSIRYRLGLMNFYTEAPGIAGGDSQKAREQARAIGQLDKVKGQLALLRLKPAFERHQSLKQLVSTYPDQPEYWFQWGLNHQQKDNYSEAFEAFEQVISLTQNASQRPDYFRALYQLGRTALFSQSRLDEGIAALRHYITQAPETDGLPEKYWARWRLVSLLKLDQQDEAARKLARTLTQVTDPEFKRLRSGP